MNVIARTWCTCDIIIFRSRYLACVLILLFVLIRNAQSACIVDISDVPMETKAQSAPSNIMFVLDNSGSMDWEFMTTEGDGLYKGKYYFSYSTGDTHLINYATGNNPYGPFTYQGVVLNPVEGWTNHHSIVEVEGKWYLFYHDVQLSGKTHLRNVKVTELKHNSDGSIQTITAYK